MKKSLTVDVIARKFRKFNDLMFGSVLPVPEIRITEARTFLGKFVCRRIVMPGGRINCRDFQIRISRSIPMSETELEDTLIHEMIHYYIAYCGVRDRTAHGPEFRRIMSRINRDFSRSIVISRRFDIGERDNMADMRCRQHVVAVVALNDGRTGLKVLPRVRDRILKFYNTLDGSSQVREIRLYVTYDPYFNRYPTSSVAKLHLVEPHEIECHLENACRLGCNGRGLIRPL